jgi:hypothetical protein
MYGFVEKKHFVNVELFLENSYKKSSMSITEDLNVFSNIVNLEEIHSYGARITQLFSFLESIYNGGTGRGFFSNGNFILKK